MYRLDEHLRGRVIQRLSCNGSLDAACDLVDNAIDVGLYVFAFRHQRGAYLCRRCGEQAVKPLGRQIGTQSDAGRQRIVIPGALDQSVEAFCGEFRTLVLGSAQHDLVVAAFDKYLGEGCGERLPARNGKQMFLVLGARAFDQRFGVEAFCLCQDRGGTSIASSQASTRRILGGAIGTGPRRIARSARDDCSMVATSRTKTSSMRSISSSEY